MSSNITTDILLNAKYLAPLLILGYVGLQLFKFLKYHYALSAIPRFRRQKGVFGAWADAREYRDDSAGVLREGYEKVNRPQAIKESRMLDADHSQFSKSGKWYQVSTPTRWVTVIPPQFLEEIRAVPENVLSSQAALADVIRVQCSYLALTDRIQILQTRHIVSPIVEEQKFHFGIVKTHVTPNLEVQVADIMEEMQLAFSDEIGSPGGRYPGTTCRIHKISDTLTEFKSVAMAHAAHRITTRTANRMLVGAPLCRNEEYLDMTVRYTGDLFGGADRVRAYPDVLKGLAAKYTTNIGDRQAVARKHLVPYITARLQQEESYKRSEKTSEWDSIKPQDSLQWIIDASPNEKERNPERLMLRVLHLNVTAVHTTSVTFLNGIYDLAFRPEIHHELRQEVIQAVSRFGWTKKALNDMSKLDSFMVESQRLQPMSSSKFLGD
jgi:hypothetical protein